MLKKVILVLFFPILWSFLLFHLPYGGAQVLDLEMSPSLQNLFNTLPPNVASQMRNILNNVQLTVAPNSASNARYLLSLINPPSILDSSTSVGSNPAVLNSQQTTVLSTPSLQMAPKSNGPSSTSNSIINNPVNSFIGPAPAPASVPNRASAPVPVPAVLSSAPLPAQPPKSSLPEPSKVTSNTVSFSTVPLNPFSYSGILFTKTSTLTSSPSPSSSSTKSSEVFTTLIRTIPLKALSSLPSITISSTSSTFSPTNTASPTAVTSSTSVSSIVTPSLSFEDAISSSISSSSSSSSSSSPAPAPTSSTSKAVDDPSLPKGNPVSSEVALNMLSDLKDLSGKSNQMKSTSIHLSIYLGVTFISMFIWLFH